MTTAVDRSLRNFGLFFLPAVPGLVLLWASAWRTLEGSGLQHDEAYTFEFASGSLSSLLQIVTTSEANMSGYYIFMHFWLTLGSSDLWIRLPSLIAASIALLLISRLVAVVSSVRWLTWLAPVALAAFPDFRFFAVEARGYAMASMFLLLAFFVWVRSNEVGVWRWSRVLGFGVALGLAGINSAFAFLALPILIIGAAMSSNRRDRLIKTLVASALAMIIFVPFVRPFFTSRQVDWIEPVPISLWPGMATAQPGLIDVLLLLSSAGLFIFAGARWLRQRRLFPGVESENAVSVMVVAAVGFSPLILLGMTSMIAQPLMTTRYLSVFVPFLVVAPILLFAPWFVRDTFPARARASVATLILVAMSMAIWPPWLDRTESDAPIAAVRKVAEIARPGDVILVYNTPGVFAKYGLAQSTDLSGSVQTDIQIHAIGWDPVTAEQAASLIGVQSVRELSSQSFGRPHVTTFAFAP
jgi:hypothetical protein